MFSTIWVQNRLLKKIIENLFLMLTSKTVFKILLAFLFPDFDDAEKIVEQALNVVEYFITVRYANHVEWTLT